jgi:hypothetical protein
MFNVIPFAQIRLHPLSALAIKRFKALLVCPVKVIVSKIAQLTKNHST